MQNVVLDCIFAFIQILMKQESKHLAYLSLGSNLGDKQFNLSKAIDFIQEYCGSIEGKSRVYSSQPWGFESENIFYNLCLIVKTSNSPELLLKNLLSIEQNMGRNREGDVYSDRIIDIDILFYDDLIINEENLIIPHPKIHERMFVLAPLEAIASEFVHPVLEVSIGKLREKCEGEVKEVE